MECFILNLVSVQCIPGEQEYSRRYELAIQPTWACKLTQSTALGLRTPGSCACQSNKGFYSGSKSVKLPSTLGLEYVREAGLGHRALFPGRSFLGPRLSYSLCSLLPLSVMSTGTLPSWPFFPLSWEKPFPHFVSSSFLLENLANSE